MRIEVILKKIGCGVAFSIIITSILYALSGSDSIGQVLLNGSMPGYSGDAWGDALMKQELNNEPIVESFNDDELIQDGGELSEIIGIDDIIFSNEAEEVQEQKKQQNQQKQQITPNSELLKNLEYLKKNYYIVDKKTGMSSDYFNIDKFNREKLKFENMNNGAKVLVFHTHAHEMFADSKAGDKNEGIVGAGARLCNNLEKKGIKTIHITDSFDVVNGKSQINGAYERMEPKITEVLKNNPSIELVIDMHRDGVNEKTHLVTTIDGKPTAQIMFFNGLCRLNSNGKLNELTGLKNPYIPTNLALSFKLKSSCDEMYPGFARKIYLNAYRYSLHMRPKSTLIEVGAQTNTKAEIYNAIDLLSEVIYKVMV